MDVCAYAGTGNVLKIQNLLHICSEHYEEKDEVCYDASHTLTTLGCIYSMFSDMILMFYSIIQNAISQVPVNTKFPDFTEIKQ